MEFPALLLPSCWWNMCPWRRGKKFNTGRISSREGKSRKWRERATSTSKGSYFSTWRPVCLYFHSYPIVLHDRYQFFPNKSMNRRSEQSFLYFVIFRLENLHDSTYFKLSFDDICISIRNRKDLVVRSTNDTRWRSMYRLNREKEEKNRWRKIKRE